MWVLPGFEEMRARELIRPGDEIRVWQEDESPYQQIVDGLKARGVATAKSEWTMPRDSSFSMEFRKLDPKLNWVGVLRVLKAAGVEAP